MDPLQGIVSPDWLKLISENKFNVSGKYWKRLLAVTIISIVNSRLKRKEDRKFGQDVEQSHVEAPIFILGHWRSGTTLLHQLITLDDSFAYPNVFQITNPHSFLMREKAVMQYLENSAAQARPMDNVELNLLSPEEHEWALVTLSVRSPLLSWTFPQNDNYYDRYLTFRDVPEKDINRWKDDFIYFLKKLTWRYKRTLALKSPADTGRIKLLLEMFPDARFINIIRNPYVVFRSTQNLYNKAISEMYLQRPKNFSIDERIFQNYNAMYDAYFEEYKSIPPGQFCEVRFEELEVDMVNQVGKIYEQLNLSGFDKSKPKIEQYAKEKAGYKKSSHKPLPSELRNKIAKEWHRSFEFWDYSM